MEEDSFGDTKLSAADMFINSWILALRYSGQGMDGPGAPHGGDDTVGDVRIGNFVGNSVMQLCGVNTDHCPADTGTGDPLSPDEGYFHNGIERITGGHTDAGTAAQALKNMR